MLLIHLVPSLHVGFLLTGTVGGHFFRTSLSRFRGCVSLFFLFPLAESYKLSVISDPLGPLVVKWSLRCLDGSTNYYSCPWGVDLRFWVWC